MIDIKIQICRNVKQYLGCYCDESGMLLGLLI